MYQIKTLNKISEKGLALFDTERYCVGEEIVPDQTQQLSIGPDADIVGNIRFNVQVLLFPNFLKLQ